MYLLRQDWKAVILIRHEWQKARISILRISCLTFLKDQSNAVVIVITCY